MIATIWEVWNDRNGDSNKSFDVFVRLMFLIIEAGLLCLLFDKPILVCLSLSLSIHFLLFDYIVTYVLIKNKVIEVKGAHWFSYVGKSSKVDNIKWWRQTSPWIRFHIRLAYFLLSLFLYFKV